MPTSSSFILHSRSLILALFFDAFVPFFLQTFNYLNHSISLMEYPRMKTPELKPFDPVEVAKQTERIVCRGDERKYTNFYATGVYGGIGTGYTCGCCLRCVFCWVDWSRDFPEKYGEFYSPEDAYKRMKKAAEEYGSKKVRISNGEPTLGREHLLPLLEYVENDPSIKLFILETNGIPFGLNEDYVKEISEFDKVHVRVSLKAGNPEQFEIKTGARREFFEIPFRAIQNLIRYEVSFHVASMSCDPRIMGVDERIDLLRNLVEVSPELLLNLEEEVVDPYDTTLKRLESAGIELEWPLRKVYKPITSIIEDVLR